MGPKFVVLVYWLTQFVCVSIKHSGPHRQGEEGSLWLKAESFTSLQAVNGLFPSALLCIYPAPPPPDNPTRFKSDNCPLWQERETRKRHQKFVVSLHLPLLPAGPWPPHQLPQHSPITKALREWFKVWPPPWLVFILTIGFVVCFPKHPPLWLESPWGKPWGRISPKVFLTTYQTHRVLFTCWSLC